MWRPRNRAQPRPMSSAMLINMASSRPTRADLEALPANIDGEIIDGVLYTMTRPRSPHQDVTLAIGGALRELYQRGNRGPGGWRILVEPGIELPNTPEISPDVAGWRRDRLPKLPTGSLTVVPDWVCEILSPTTRRHDLVVKQPYYAKVGVKYHWMIDLEARCVIAFRLHDGDWHQTGVYSDERDARIAPFDETPLDVASWWDELPTELASE